MDAAAVTLATDIFHLTVTDTAIIHMLELGQTTDLGDAAEEVLRIGLYRAVTGGSGGTAATEVAYNRGDNTAPTGAVLTNNTTASTAGTLLQILTWNIRIPTQWIWTPEMRPRFDSGEDPVSFRLLTAPTDSVTCSGTPGSSGPHRVYPEGRRGYRRHLRPAERLFQSTRGRSPGPDRALRRRSPSRSPKVSSPGPARHLRRTSAFRLRRARSHGLDRRSLRASR
jgi:hypothetical protein